MCVLLGVTGMGVLDVGVPGVLLGVCTAGCDRRGCVRCTGLHEGLA